MKKNLLLSLLLIPSLLLFILSLATSVFALEGRGKGMKGGMLGGLNPSKQIIAEYPTGLTFYKDFTKSQSGNANSLNAEYALGSPIATFTASRSATTPATYVDSNGVIQLVTTSNVPRFPGGYYDDTGFHQLTSTGILIEGTEYNRVTYSESPENAAWTKTNITADDDDNGSTSPDGKVTANSLTASAANGTLVQAYPITGAAVRYTASCWLKRKTGTGKIYLGPVEDGTGKTEVTLTTSWCRFQINASTDGDDAGKDPAFYLEIETDTDAVYIYGTQLEAHSYMTSYIPTTDTALQRNLDVLKYATLRNRTAGAETISIKYIPFWGSTKGTGARYLIDNEGSGGNRRVMDFVGRSSQTTEDITSYANTVISTTSFERYAGIDMIINTSNVSTAVFQHYDPYISYYFNGTSIPNTSGTNEDFTDVAYGTSFFVGYGNSGTSMFDGLIQNVKIFNRALTAAEVATLQ